MIPEFPEFKKLELSDKDDIENFTKQFPPYSDFNFVSMWSWDIKGDMRVAWFNGNLVVKFNDYLTGEPFYSFLGTNKVNETAAALIEISHVLGQEKYIALIPETTAKLLDSEEFLITEDENQADYIFDLKYIAEMSGSHFASKRTGINKFKRSFPEYRLVVLDPKDPETKSNIKKVNSDWLQEKAKKDPYCDVQNEFSALDKFFEGNFSENFLITAIFIDQDIKAYLVSEELGDGYVVCHYVKSDFSYDGIYSLIMQETAKMLLEKGFKFWNFEQDLGLPGLKSSKKYFSTGTFLGKYSVVLK